MKKVVCLAQQAEVQHVGFAKPCIGFDVVELEKRPSLAAPSV
jgi:hypothetical protein